ncbi:MAG: hypothetical protein WAW06_02775 [bacterium]
MTEQQATILRDQIEESLHYLIISVIAESLEREGFAVTTDHVSGRGLRPVAVGGFVPDIVARREGDTRLIEVETQATLQSARAKAQLAAYAAEPGARVYVAVPFDCIEGARRIREEAGFDVGIIPCYPFVRYVGIQK